MNATPSKDEARLSWRVPAIDGVRALAMLMVYSYHVWEFAKSPKVWVHFLGQDWNLLYYLRTFPAGVDLFMVLSGFCLFLPLCKSNAALENWDVKNYFVRRFRRIAPPYYAAILYFIFLPQVLVVVFRALHMEAHWQSWPTLWQLFTHVFFIHTLFTQTWDGLNGSFWSLGLEAQFYLVFPLVILVYKRFGWRTFAGLVAISLLYRIIGGFYFLGQPHSIRPFLYSIFFLGRWMEFGLGMAAAWYVASYWREGRSGNARVGTFTVVGAAVLYCVAVSKPVAAITLFPLRDLLLAVTYSSLMVALCITPTRLRWFFENKVMVGLGFISYSFFLIHQPTAWLISEFFKKKLHVQGGVVLWLLLCSVGFLMIWGVARVFFALFEKPFLSGPKKEAPPSQVGELVFAEPIKS